MPTPNDDLPSGFSTTIQEELERSANQTIPLSSSWLRSCYYDAKEQTLLIDTIKNSYTLHGVPPDVFVDFISADSPGSFFNDSLKGKY